MVYRENLKIQFRAVAYGHSNHVLEYRIDPNQDLTYEKTYGFWIFKFTIKRKFSTKQIRMENGKSINGKRYAKL